MLERVLDGAYRRYGYRGINKGVILELHLARMVLKGKFLP